jgi:hypothetical protein
MNAIGSTTSEVLHSQSAMGQTIGQIKKLYAPILLYAGYKYKSSKRVEK